MTSALPLAQLYNPFLPIFDYHFSYEDNSLQGHQQPSVCQIQWAFYRLVLTGLAALSETLKLLKTLYDLDVYSTTLSGFLKLFFFLSGFSVLAQSLNYECFSEAFPGFSAFLTLAQHCPAAVTHVALEHLKCASPN